MQSEGGGIEPVARDRQHTAGRAAIVADAAGIDEPQPVMVVDVWVVRMPEEECLRTSLMGSIGGTQQGGLYPQCVPVAQKQPVCAEKDEALALLKAPKVAVPGYLLKREAWIEPVQLLRIAPSVTEMDDGIERVCLLKLHGAEHIVRAAVGIGENKKLHKSAAAPQPGQK